VRCSRSLRLPRPNPRSCWRGSESGSGVHARFRAGSAVRRKQADRRGIRHARRSNFRKGCAVRGAAYAVRLSSGVGRPVSRRRYVRGIACCAADGTGANTEKDEVRRSSAQALGHRRTGRPGMGARLEYVANNAAGTSPAWAANRDLTVHWRNEKYPENARSPTRVAAAATRLPASHFRKCDTSRPTRAQDRI
jgi:hypothetical protein